MRPLLCTVLASTLSLMAAPPVWQNDFAAAQAQARREGKPLMALFTGSSWCPYCILLEKEVLATPEFAAWAARAVLVKVDYPTRKERTPEKLAANKALADLIALKDTYKVPGFPTVLWFGPDGTELHRVISYQKGTGPAGYLAPFSLPKAK